MKQDDTGARFERADLACAYDHAADRISLERSKLSGDPSRSFVLILAHALDKDGRRSLFPITNERRDVTHEHWVRCQTQRVRNEQHELGMGVNERIVGVHGCQQITRACVCGAHVDAAGL